jgi:hypothetical protein
MDLSFGRPAELFGGLWSMDDPPRFRLSDTKVSSIVRESFESKGWVEWAEGDPEPQLNWRASRFKPSEYAAATSVRLVNHFPSTTAITRKDNLVRNMRRMQHVHGAIYAFTPTTFLLPTEYEKFVEASQKRQGAAWICKPSDASQGQGIFIIRDANEISSTYYNAFDGGSGRARREPSVVQPMVPIDADSSSESDGDEEAAQSSRARANQFLSAEPTGGRAIHGDVSVRYTLKALRARLNKTTAPCVSFSRLHIVQHYLDRPALLDGRKFDLRIYVLVTSFAPLRVYIYRDAIVRLATARYDMANLSDPYAHLTNASINKTVNAEGCKRALSRLEGESEIAGHLRRPEFRRRVAQLVNLTILPIATAVPDNGGCFELLGFDVLVDAAGAPWLIEVNCSPALTVDCPADVTVKGSMLAEMLDVLVATKYARAHKPNVARAADGRGRAQSARAAAMRPTSVPPLPSPLPGAQRGASSAARALPPLPVGAARDSQLDEFGEAAAIGGWELAFPFDETTRNLARSVAGREAEVVAHIRAALASPDGIARQPAPLPRARASSARASSRPRPTAVPASPRAARAQSNQRLAATFSRPAVPALPRPASTALAAIRPRVGVAMPPLRVRAVAQGSPGGASSARPAEWRRHCPLPSGFLNARQ